MYDYELPPWPAAGGHGALARACCWQNCLWSLARGGSRCLPTHSQTQNPLSLQTCQYLANPAKAILLKLTRLLLSKQTAPRTALELDDSGRSWANSPPASAPSSPAPRSALSPAAWSQRRTRAWRTGSLSLWNMMFLRPICSYKSTYTQSYKWGKCQRLKSQI